MVPSQSLCSTHAMGYDTALVSVLPMSGVGVVQVVRARTDDSFSNEERAIAFQLYAFVSISRVLHAL